MMGGITLKRIEVNWASELLFAWISFDTLINEFVILERIRRIIWR